MLVLLTLNWCTSEGHPVTKSRKSQGVNMMLKPPTEELDKDIDISLPPIGSQAVAKNVIRTYLGYNGSIDSD
jgi:hypothetical protein